MIESMEDGEFFQHDLPKSLGTCLTHSKDEFTSISNKTLEVSISENLFDKSPISDLYKFVMQDLEELALDLPTERLISESVEVEDPLQPTQNSEEEDKKSPNLITSSPEVSYTLEECLTYFEDWDDPMIQDIVNALRERPHAPKKLPSIECQIEESTVEAQAINDYVETIPMFEDEAIEVSTSLWFVQTEEHFWDDPFLNSFCPDKKERRPISPDFQPIQFSFPSTCDNFVEEPAEIFQQDFQWARLVDVTNVLSKAGWWIVLLNNLLHHLMILLNFVLMDVLMVINFLV